MNEQAILELYNDIKEEYDVGSINDFKSYLSDKTKEN